MSEKRSPSRDAAAGDSRAGVPWSVAQHALPLGSATEWTPTPSARGSDSRAPAPESSRAGTPQLGSDAPASCDGDLLRDGDPTAAAQGAPTARWQALFAGGSPREILSRIVQGDPLSLREHVARRLRADAYLVDADRVHLRCLARCARRAVRYHGRPELAAWLETIVIESIEELHREDQESALGSSDAEATHGGAFSALARPLGLDPRAMRSACVVFNRMSAPERRAFFDLVIRGRSLDELARESGESATEIARRARRALDALLSGPCAAPVQNDAGAERS